MRRGIEIEWQLACRDAAALGRWLARARFSDGWDVAPLGIRRLVDAYWDTADGRVARAGFALRVRRVGGAVEATLKALRGVEAGTPAGDAAGGLARRRAITARASTARIAAVRASTGRVGKRLRRISGSRPLRRLFSVRTHRSVFALRDGSRVIAEVALDRSEIRAPGARPRRFERLEIEVTAGPVARVAAFVAVLCRRRRLVPAVRSKFEEGLRVVALESVRRR